MESIKNSAVKKSERRSKRVRNLEEEVQFIFSQDESDADCNFDVNKNEVCCKTPRTRSTKYVSTPSASHIVPQDFSQTPRRSCRKSVKPSQDYEDIVNKSLRSAKKNLLIAEEEQDENHDVEIVQPKWNPAKVGRVSQKRGRKSKRALKGKNQVEKNEQLDERKTYDIEDGETEEVDGTEKLVKALEIVAQNENDPTEDNTKLTDNYIVEIKENSEAIIDEVKMRVHNETQQNKEFKKESITLQEMDFVENVDYVKPLNPTSEYKNCEENKEKQKEGKAVDENETDDDSKDTNESEDCQKFTEKCKQETICIIYENNISNRQIKENSEDDIQCLISKRSTLGGERKDSFGCYLKSNEMNISDLGLNLLKDEEEEKDLMDNQDKQSLKEVEEMPSLIVCDDDEYQVAEPCNKLNETFEANDASKEVGEIVENTSKHAEEVMETLQLSDDDGETPKKHNFRLANTELRNHSIFSTPKVSSSQVKLSSPKVLDTPKLPKQKTISHRFPTPFRSKQNFKFDEVKENIAKTPSKHILNASVISITTLEPKEIVLRGIRKRSLSVSIDVNENKRHQFLAGPLAKVKQDRIVSFYSPANQTAIIDDLDEIIAKSMQKQKPKEKELVNRFVTTRRKRSISLDESVISSKLPRPVCQNIANKSQTSTSKQLSRTKLPNFAAIHQKRFQKMENLVEHISRKQERSKNLINSASKLKPASAEKNESIIKNINNISTGKPNALKKIDLGSVSKMNKSVLNITTVPSEASETKQINLPNPILTVARSIKSGSASRKLPRNQQQNKYLKPSQNTNIENSRLNAKSVAPSKPAFNLSTSLMVKPTTSSSVVIEKADTSHKSSEDKMTSRLKRHMDLFKGRVASARAAGGTASRRNEVILKGVRSNRRFELQMQHRKNLEQ